MSTVVQRIKEISQPRGGYINPKKMQLNQLTDNEILYPQENIHATTIGMAVDYLTRYMIGEEKKKAFEISLLGAENASYIYQKNTKKQALNYLSDINGLDDRSIINTCKITAYDVWYRNPDAAMFAKGPEEINPDKETIHNIRVMVQRSIKFFDLYGHVVKSGFSFEGGYTETVTAGDGDFLTKETLWDFKVSKSLPTNKQTLQLAMYYIMGKHSGKSEYKDINQIGIFNPRLNRVYTLKMDEIPQNTIEEIENYVIGY